jgi:hypothetical protein
LGRVDVVILEEEGLIHAIFLQCGEFDEQVQWACKGFLKYEILLASDLDALVGVVDCAVRFYLTPSSSWSRSRRDFSVISAALKGVAGAIFANVSRRIKYIN